MRYKITIEYDGSKLLGWQKQADGPTAQDFLEKALCTLIPQKQSEDKLQISNTSNPDNVFSEKGEVLSSERRSGVYSGVHEHSSTEKGLQISTKNIIHGAGRTDAGVHALGQVAHFDTNKITDSFHLREGLNAILKLQNAPVSVLEVEAVSDDFHARFSAIGRGYIYRILNRRAPTAIDKDRVWWVPVPLDINKMQEAANHLLGHHDFTSFRASACQALSPLKTLDKLEITKVGEEIHFCVEARSFLHHQVRNFVGTLKMVGDGHLTPDDVKRILEACDRNQAGVTAPAHGLYLNRVMY